jgi:CBS-domain-containing membrane protein
MCHLRAEHRESVTMADKDLNKLLRKAEKQGWRIVERSSGAILCYSPDGETVATAHKTQSDHRALRNFTAQLRKGGFTP